MKSIIRSTVIAASLSLASFSQAAITYADPYSTGEGYTWLITMGSNGSESTAGFDVTADVGIWSWRQSGSTPSRGWTHTSDWAKLTLTESATLTVIMGRNSSVENPSSPGSYLPVDKLFPSFSIWTGTYTSEEFNSNHTYLNLDTITWATGITALNGAVDNSTETTATLTVQLQPGDYTIALGGNGPTLSGSQQGYYASFSTSPIPEPSSALLGASLGGLFLARRRR